MNGSCAPLLQPPSWLLWLGFWNVILRRDEPTVQSSGYNTDLLSLPRRCIWSGQRSFSCASTMLNLTLLCPMLAQLGLSRWRWGRLVVLSVVRNTPYWLHCFRAWRECRIFTVLFFRSKAIVKSDGTVMSNSQNKAWLVGSTVAGGRHRVE